MSGTAAAGGDRLLDLLAARATEGLAAGERSELDLLLDRHPEIDPDALDLAAAEAHLAFLEEEGLALEELPASARRRLEDAATAFIAGLDGGRPASGRVVALSPATPRGASPALAWSGWLAAAAALILALFLGGRDGGLGGRDGGLPVPTVPHQVAATPAEQRERLLESESDAIQVAWAPPEIPGYEGVTGDVVWSSRAQAGYMRLRGLPANTPGEAQYQLWIVDPGRDEEPVDGGVFDVPAGRDEVVIPIDSKLAVESPAAFAITLEKPGGVVVSDGPLLVVAPVESRGA